MADNTAVDELWMKTIQKSNMEKRADKIRLLSTAINSMIMLCEQEPETEVKKNYDTMIVWCRDKMYSLIKEN